MVTTWFEVRVRVRVRLRVRACERARPSLVMSTYPAPTVVVLYCRRLSAVVADATPDAGGRRANPSPHTQSRRSANVPQVSGSSKSSPPSDANLEAENER